MRPKSALLFIVSFAFFFMGARNVFNVSISSLFIISYSLFLITSGKFVFLRIFLPLFVFALYFVFINPKGYMLLAFQMFLYPILVFNVFYDLFKNISLNYIRFFVGTSIFVLLLQFLSIDFFWRIPEFLQGIEYTNIFSNSQRLKPSGLSLYSVQFSYFGFLFGVIIYYFSTDDNKFEFLFLKIMLFIAAIVSENLSLIFSLIFLYFKNINLKNIIKYVISLSPFSIFFIDRLLSPDASILSRFLFLGVAWDLIFRHPFGLSLDNLTHEKEVSILNIGFDNVEVLAILDTSFHNTFLNIAVLLGLIFGIFYIVLLYLMGTRFFPRNKKVLLAYLFLCFFHNAGPLTRDYYFWLILAFVYWFDNRLINENNAKVKT